MPSEWPPIQSHGGKPESTSRRWRISTSWLASSTSQSWSFSLPQGSKLRTRRLPLFFEPPEIYRTTTCGNSFVMRNSEKPRAFIGRDHVQLQGGSGSSNDPDGLLQRTKGPRSANP